MNDKDRIRLAEAIGWTREHSGIENDPFPYMWRTPKGEIIPPTFTEEGCPLYPDTDASDDYALLAFFRDSRAFRDQLNIDDAAQYSVGDYARAALKVLDDAS